MLDARFFSVSCHLYQLLNVNTDGKPYLTFVSDLIKVGKLEIQTLTG